MENIKLDESTYVGKDKFGYKIINPIRKNLELPFQKGNINWKNLLVGGSWFNIVKLLILLLILGSIIYGYMLNTNECREMVKHPKDFCEPVCKVENPYSPAREFNITLPEVDDGDNIR